MAAQIQVDANTPGTQVVTVNAGDTVTLVDSGGGAPVAWEWTIPAFPDTLSVAPTVTDDTTASASFVAADPDSYEILLTRQEADLSFTQAMVIVQADDGSGMPLPSPDQDGDFYNSVRLLNPTLRSMRTALGGSSGVLSGDSTAAAIATDSFTFKDAAASSILNVSIFGGVTALLQSTLNVSVLSSSAVFALAPAIHLGTAGTGGGEVVISSSAMTLRVPVVADAALAAMSYTHTQAASGAGGKTTLRAQRGASGQVGGALWLGSGYGGTFGSVVSGDVYIDLGDATSSALAKLHVVRDTSGSENGTDVMTFTRDQYGLCTFDVSGTARLQASSEAQIRGAGGSISFWGSDNGIQALSLGLSTSGANTVTWNAGATSITYGQQNKTTNGGTAADTTFAAQNETGTGSTTAGSFIVKAGTVTSGTGTAGNVKLNANGHDQIICRGDDTIAVGVADTSQIDLTAGNNVNLFAGSSTAALTDGGIAITTDSFTYNGGAVMTGTTIVKGADQTVSSGTLANDSDLAFSIAAGESWTFEFSLPVNLDANGGFKFKITAPAASTASHVLYGYVDGFGSVTTSLNTPTADTAISTANADTFLRITGAIVNGVNAGTVQLQFAENSGGGGATVKASSYIKANRVA